MKLRYLFFALLTLSTATALTAQTMTATTVAAKAKTARSVYKDLRNRKVQKATTTVLKDKDVSRHLNLDKNFQDKLADPKLASNLRKAKTEMRKDPVSFAEKNGKDLRKAYKNRPKWLFNKHKKRSSRKK
jgi:hypothetical protein